MSKAHRHAAAAPQVHHTQRQETAAIISLDLNAIHTPRSHMSRPTATQLLHHKFITLIAKHLQPAGAPPTLK